MTSSVEDIYTIALNMMAAANTAKSEVEAVDAVRAIASDLGADDLRRVSTFLAVHSVRKMRPRSSRRAVGEWIERMRFALITKDLGSEGSVTSP